MNSTRMDKKETRRRRERKRGGCGFRITCSVRQFISPVATAAGFFIPPPFPVGTKGTERYSSSLSLLLIQPRSKPKHHFP